MKVVNERWTLEVFKKFKVIKKLEVKKKVVLEKIIFSRSKYLLSRKPDPSEPSKISGRISKHCVLRMTTSLNNR